MPSTVAYVLKAYPRRSELFVASEIHRLEQAGLALRLFVILPRDEDEQHAVVERIRAVPDRLPRTTSLSPVSLAAWLRANGRVFRAPLVRVARRRPLGLARALMLALHTRRGAHPVKFQVRELLRAIALADRVLAARDVRHLHAHFAHDATTVTWLAATITGLPFSFTAHAKDIYSQALNPGDLLQKKLRAARFAVTCTDANREHLRALAPDAAVHRVYHGLNADLARLVDDQMRNRAADPTLRVLSVGRLVGKKGFDVAVTACARLVRRGVDVHLRIVGEDGPESDSLARLIARHGLEHHVDLVGPLGQAELRDEYDRADVFCLPCRIVEGGDRDGIPNVLVEAMACRLPVVTTGISGIPELVADGETGLLVPPDDVDAIAAALECLHEDPALAARIAARAADVVRERFDGDRLAARLVELFDREAA